MRIKKRCCYRMITSASNKIIHYPQFFGKCLGYLQQKKKVLPQTFIEPRSNEILALVREKMPQEGLLTLDPSGHLFLKIPDTCIYEIYDLMQRNELDLPPYFASGIGAHISVALNTEVKKIPSLLNQSISFTVTGCYFTTPSNMEDIKYVWYLLVESADIESVRSQLGLEPKIAEQEFHITFAMQKQFLNFNDIMRTGENHCICINGSEIAKGKIRFHKNSENQ